MEPRLDQTFHNVFICSCSLTSEEVRELYWRGGAEANESTDIVFLSTKVGDLIHHKYIWICTHDNGSTVCTDRKRPIAESLLPCSFFIVFPSPVTMQELLQLDSSRPMWSELCPSAKGAVLLYQRVRPDASIRPEQASSDQQKHKEQE